MAAPTRVQVTPHAQALATTTVSMTFSSPPTVGNAIVVAFIYYALGGNTTTCADNRGNTYSSSGANTSGNIGVKIFHCSNVTTSGTPFIVTITANTATYFEASAIEVGSTGGNLVVDKTTGSGSGTTTIGTGSTAALTNADVFIVSGFSVTSNQSSITVESVSPSWTQEFEQLSYSTSVAGEIDSRSRTGVSGTTQSCSWTVTTGAPDTSLIVVFAPTVTTEARISQYSVEILSQPVPAINITQYSVEILSATVATVVTESTQFMIVMP